MPNLHSPLQQYRAAIGQNAVLAHQPQSGTLKAQQPAAAGRRASARRQGPDRGNDAYPVMAMLCISLLLVSNVALPCLSAGVPSAGRRASSYGKPGRCQAASPGTGPVVLSQFGPNLTGISQLDFADFCVESHEQWSGHKRAACQADGIYKIKKRANFGARYAYGSRDGKPISILSLASASAAQTVGQRFMLASKRELHRDARCQYQMTLGIDAARGAQVTFFKIIKRLPRGQYRDVFSLSRNGSNHLIGAEWKNSLIKRYFDLASLSDYGIRISDYFTLLVDIVWHTRRRPLLSISLKQGAKICPLLCLTHVLGSKDPISFRARVGMVAATGSSAVVNLEHYAEHYQELAHSAQARAGQPAPRQAGTE